MDVLCEGGGDGWLWGGMMGLIVQKKGWGKL